MFKELFVSPQTGSEFEVNSDFGNGTLVCSRKLEEGTYRVRIQSDDLQLLEMLAERLSLKWSGVKAGDHISCVVSSKYLMETITEAEQAIEYIYEEEEAEEEPIEYDYEDLTDDYEEELEEYGNEHDILLEDKGGTVEQPEISKQKAEKFPAEVAYIGGKKIIVIPQEYQMLGMLDDGTIVVKKK